MLRALKEWFRPNRSSQAAGKGNARPPRRARLGLEQLEDRLTPTSLTVTSALDPAPLTPGTLRYAVSRANLDAAHGISDTISFNTALMGGTTITLQRGKLELSGAGSGVITIDGKGQVTVSGNNASRAFQVDGGVKAVITGVTIVGGNAGTGYGGGIENFGSLRLSNDRLAGNKARYGGGIFNQGTLIVTATTISGNSAYSGGGIYTQSNATLSSSTVSSNSASVDGGGIGNTATLTVSNSTLSGNTAARWGGGILNQSGTLTVSGCILSGNVTQVNNSGLTKIDVSNYGGGIYNSSAAALTLINSTLTANRSWWGGGIFNYAGLGGSPGRLQLQATTVAGNSASGVGPDINGPVITGSASNLIGSGAGLTGMSNGANGNQVGRNATWAKPVLAPPIAAIAAGPGQGLWVLTSNDVLLAINGTGWQLVSPGIASIATGPGQSVYELTTGGALYVNAGVGWQLASSGGVQSIATGPSQSLYELTTGGALYVNAGAGWQLVSSGGVRSIATGPGRSLYELTTSGWLYVNAGAGWQLVSGGGVQSIATGPGRSLYELTTSGALYVNAGAGWQLASSDIASIAGGYWDIVTVRTKSGMVWKITPSGWIAA